MEIALTLAGLVAVAVKIGSALKFIEAKDWLALRNQVGAWIIGILVIFWGATIQSIQDQEISGIALTAMTASTKFYIGFALGSVGSVIYDAIVSNDNNRTSKV